MSELKVYVKPLKTNVLGQTIVGQSYYLKSEADKVIAEKDAQILDLIERVQKERSAKVDYKISANDLNDGLKKAYEEIDHQKHKRCLAMAQYCEAMRGHYLSYEEPKWFWYREWANRWLKLAEKFKDKEAK